jgi:hypothetical protein
MGNYNTTIYKEKNKSFLLQLEIPQYIKGESPDYNFEAIGNRGLYDFNDYSAPHHLLSHNHLLSLNEIYKQLKDIPYNFTIGYSKEAPKYLAPHPISGNITDWGNERTYVLSVINAGRRAPFAEHIIAKSPENSYIYAKNMIKGRWEPGEAAILTNVFSSYCYVRDIIKGKWEPAESIISKSAQYSYCYAKYILNGRFELGENAIATVIPDNFELRWPYSYAKEIIGGRFPLAEETIIKSDRYIYIYARDVIKGRWPEAEAKLSENVIYSYKYAEDVIRGRFLIAEKNMIKDLRKKGARDYKQLFNLKKNEFVRNGD